MLNLKSIEKENHLNQTSMFGSQLLIFQGVTKSSFEAICTVTTDAIYRSTRNASFPTSSLLTTQGTIPPHGSDHGPKKPGVDAGLL